MMRVPIYSGFAWRSQLYLDDNQPVRGVFVVLVVVVVVVVVIVAVVDVVVVVVAVVVTELKF